MKKLKKFLVTALAITLLSMPFSNVAMAAKIEFKSGKGSNSLVEVSDSLDEILQRDNVSKEELEEYSKYAKSELSKKPTPQWKLGAAKNVLEFIVDNRALIPSKTIRGYVDRWGNNIIDAIDNLEVASKVGIQLALEEAGVPEHVAKAIADFVVRFLL